MGLTAPALVLFTAALLEGVSSSVTWTYADVDNWPSQFPLCGGSRQSPIDFNRYSMQYFYFPRIQFINYDSLPSSLIVSNTGNNLQVTYKCPVVPSIAGGGLGSAYIFSEYHLHWGSDEGRGSEHTVDGVRYPMEIHMVHFNAKYGNMTTAATMFDGVAILVIFFTLTTYDNPALSPILAQVPLIREFEGDTIQTETSMNLSPFAAMLPPTNRRFFRYRGSLTAPTCDEVVLWTVFEEPQGVSRSQLEILRTLVDKEGEPISNNFRPTQPTNGRTVLRSFHYKHTGFSALPQNEYSSVPYKASFNEYNPAPYKASYNKYNPAPYKASFNEYNPAPYKDSYNEYSRASFDGFSPTSYNIPYNEFITASYTAPYKAPYNAPHNEYNTVHHNKYPSAPYNSPTGAWWRNTI